MISSTTPRTLAAMHTQATSSLLVTTANTNATSPIRANTSAMISIGHPPADERDGGVRHSSGLVITPVELVEPTGVRTGINRCRRSALAEFLKLGFQVGLEPGPVLALECTQLLEA